MPFSGVSVLMNNALPVVASKVLTQGGFRLPPRTAGRELDPRTVSPYCGLDAMHIPALDRGRWLTGLLTHRPTGAARFLWSATPHRDRRRP